MNEKRVLKTAQFKIFFSQFYELVSNNMPEYNWTSARMVREVILL